MKNVLVIGGSYFAGRVFVEELLRSGGYTPYVLNRGNRPLNLDGVNEIRCERRDIAKLAQLVPALEWHAVVDFCAYEPGDVAKIVENLPGTVSQYIYISTASVHRNSTALPMREDAPTLDAPLPGPGGDYAYKKLLLEGELRKCCEEKGISHVTLRPVFIYGKYNYAPRESYFFDLIDNGEPIVLPSLPQPLFSMISVWDLARICVACLGNGKVAGKAYMVSADELVSYDYLMEVLEAITAKKYDVRRQPLRLINAAKISLPFALEEHLVYSGARLGEDLNYRYMSFAEGMAKTYEWYSKARAR